MQIEPDWVELKRWLYGPDGHFPEIRRRDVLALVEPIARTSRFTGVTYLFLTPEHLATLDAHAKSLTK